MGKKEIIRNLKATINKPGNEDVKAKLQKKLDQIESGRINK